MTKFHKVSWCISAKWLRLKWIIDILEVNWLNGNLDLCSRDGSETIYLGSCVPERLWQVFRENRGGNGDTSSQAVISQLNLKLILLWAVFVQCEFSPRFCSQHSSGGICPMRCGHWSSSFLEELLCSVPLTFQLHAKVLPYFISQKSLEAEDVSWQILQSHAELSQSSPALPAAPQHHPAWKRPPRASSPAWGRSQFQQVPRADIPCSSRDGDSLISQSLPAPSPWLLWGPAVSLGLVWVLWAAAQH